MGIALGVAAVIVIVHGQPAGSVAAMMVLAATLVVARQSRQVQIIRVRFLFLFEFSIWHRSSSSSFLFSLSGTIRLANDSFYAFLGCDPLHERLTCVLHSSSMSAA